jgi:hypothetical protein
MRNFMAIVFAGMLAAAAGFAAADEKAMKEHEEMGKKGVTPEMMKNKDKELSAKEREEAKKRHVQEGTKGVTPHALKKKPSPAGDKEAMKKHEEMGKKGVYPEGKPETTK